jgi:hypothetical protein
MTFAAFEREEIMKTKLVLSLGVLLSLPILSTQCVAQWMTQEIPLTSGWNAVYLSVQPSSTDCASVLAGVPIQSIAMWSKRDAQLRFTTDPAQPLPHNPDWLYWMPSEDPQALLSSLFSIHGGQSYLIRLRSDAAPITWRIKGNPVPFNRQWRSQSLNLTGLPVPPETVTFENFFRSASTIKTVQTEGGEIYQVNSTGQPIRIWQPARTKVQPGMAYWIRCGDAARFTGQLRVELDYGTTLEFAAGVWTRRLVMKNESHAAITAQVRLLPSETPPLGAAPLAGGVPLSYRERDWTHGSPRDIYRVLGTSVSRSLAPGETWTLELTLRRDEMRGATAGASWQSLLEVTDGGTVRQWIGINAL